MTVLKAGFHNGKETIEFLKELISSGQYLFHLTDPMGCKSIIEEKTVRPLTLDGTRANILVARGIPEKGTASFTEDPIQIYEEDHSDCFIDKNIVLVFNRSVLQHQGVKPARYVTEEELLGKYLEDYRYAVEEADFETEWRSTEVVNIEDALMYICYVPKRYYDGTVNALRFLFDI